MTTQTSHPWRATLRTLFQIVVALAALAPFVIEAAEVPDTVPAVAAVLVVAGAITRVMALPQVNAFLERFVPWLAAAPSPRVDGAIVVHPLDSSTLDVFRSEAGGPWTKVASRHPAAEPYIDPTARSGVEYEYAFAPPFKGDR